MMMKFARFIGQFTVLSGKQLSAGGLRPQTNGIGTGWVAWENFRTYYKSISGEAMHVTAAAPSSRVLPSEEELLLSVHGVKSEG